jgi:hypothetical protein
MRISIALGLSIFLVSGCWADFPMDRLNVDSAIWVEDSWAASDRPMIQDSPRRDGPRPDRAITKDQRPTNDGRPAADGKPSADAKSTCVANAFIQCASKNQLIKCNAQGTATVTVDCGKSNCSTTLKRCDECNPSEPSQCAGSEVTQCTIDGLYKKTLCPLGCNLATKTCCKDEDQDVVTDCLGDCDDQDPDVFPAQTQFFTTPNKKGTYDFNCDLAESLEFPNLILCQQDQNCSGSGWIGYVPKCGQPGTMGICSRVQNQCVPTPTSSKNQGCR